jgi:hypothetical protein
MFDTTRNAIKRIVSEYKTPDGAKTPFTADFSGDKEPSSGSSVDKELKSQKEMAGAGKKFEEWDKKSKENSPLFSGEGEEMQNKDLEKTAEYVEDMSQLDVETHVENMNITQIARVYNYLFSNGADNMDASIPEMYQGHPDQMRDALLEYDLQDLAHAIEICVPELYQFSSRYDSNTHLGQLVSKLDNRNGLSKNHLSITSGNKDRQQTEEHPVPVKNVKMGSIVQTVVTLETPTNKVIKCGSLATIEAVDPSGKIGWLKGKDGGHYGWVGSEYFIVKGAEGDPGAVKVKKPDPTIAPGLTSKNLELGSTADGDTAKITLEFNDLDAGLNFFNSVGGKSAGGQQPQAPQQAPQMPQQQAPQQQQPEMPTGGGEQEQPMPQPAQQ